MGAAAKAEAHALRLRDRLPIETRDYRKLSEAENVNWRSAGPTYRATEASRYGLPLNPKAKLPPRPARRRPRSRSPLAP